MIVAPALGEDMHDIGIWRTAFHMVNNYGRTASRRAATQSKKMALRADQEGIKNWSIIEDAIKAVQEAYLLPGPRKSRRIRNPAK